MSTIVDVDGVIDELVAETGLADFGDPTYRDGLDVFVEALDREADLNDIGRAAAAGQIKSALLNRLQIEHWWSEHPELADERIESPIFIVGMSRSGTTALSHLLACDPPDMPVECLVTMAQHFVSLSLPAIFPLPSYARWVLGANHAPVYRWHDRVLRLLQSGGVRGRWQLKSPHHAIALEALTAQYPDARFIVTHRDPATCVASAASLAREFADYCEGFAEFL